MKENMDMVIRSKIQQEQIKVPDSYFKRINLTLQNLPEKTTRYHLKYAAAVAAGLCLMISGTVYAAANYVQQRMLSMDETEKKEMIDYTIHSVKDIDTYSRELTAVEKERMETLLYEYQVQGKFPENGLEIVDDGKMISSDTVAFVTEDSMFVLPERTLTDEELLQIIDFYFKRDYSLMTSREDLPKEVLSVEEAVGENAVEQMKTMLHILYQIETDNLEISLEADINGVVYRIEAGSSGQVNYRALYDLASGRIVEIGSVCSMDVAPEKREPDNEHFTEVGEGLAETINRLESNAAIREIYCDYNVTEDAMLARETVSYLYRLEDDTCYVVQYNIAVDAVTDVLIVSYQEYHQILDRNAAKRAERGIERIRLTISFSDVPKKS